MSQLNTNLTEILRQKSQYLLPQNLRSGIRLLGVTGTYGGQDTINLFIQETEPEMYDGIWIETDSLEYDNIVEVADKTSLIANSINIVKGSDRETILFYSNNGLSYRFDTVYLTDEDNEILSDIEIYYGDGSQWKKVHEYTELEYIQSTGTQYIDTGYKANNNTKIEIKYKTMDTLAYHAIFGVRSSRYLYMLDAVDTNYNTKEIGYYSNYNKPSLSFTTHEIETTVVLNKNVFTISNINGTNTRTFSTGTFDINLNCYLFAFNDNGSVQRIGKTNIYYCKIYDNDVLVHDFIPVKDPNDVVCLYDKVSRDYFYNAGTGTFIAGGVV